MADVPGNLKLHRSVQLDPTLKVDYYDRTDPAGRGHVVARFEEKVTDAETRVFRTDLDRVEEAVSRAYVYRTSGEAAERSEPFLGVVARLKRGEFPGRIDPISVHLMQKAPDGSGQWQALEASESSWSRAAHEGREVEQELGYGDRHHLLVYGDSLRKDAEGRIHAKVAGCFDSEEQALVLADRDEGLAFLERPRRRSCSEGDIVEVSPHAGLQALGGRFLRSGEEQLALAEAARERAGLEQGQGAISTDSDDRSPPRDERRQEFGRGL